jgi:4'-phosphopantetheinyl transferase
MQPASENTVQIWVERSADYTDTAQLEALLDDQERARARKFVFEKDSKNFIVAHALKRRRIAEKLNISDPSVLRFATDASGKPYSLDADIHFNLSHSHGVSALALSNVSPCGVDIEAHRPISQLTMLIQKTMTRNEQNQIDIAPSKLKAFIDRWVLKEAYLKLSGEGLAVPLTSICTASEVVDLQSCFGVLRGVPLFFKRGKGYSLAASSKNAGGLGFISAAGSWKLATHDCLFNLSQ